MAHIAEVIKAYAAGRKAAQDQSIAIVHNPIKAPDYGMRQQALLDAFWKGVQDWRDERKATKGKRS